MYVVLYLDRRSIDNSWLCDCIFIVKAFSAVVIETTSDFNKEASSARQGAQVEQVLPLEKQTRTITIIHINNHS